MNENHNYINRGFTSLVKALAPYIARELETQYKADWWEKGVLLQLYGDQKRNLPETGEKEALINNLDIALCLLLLDVQWNNVFKRKLSIDHRNWVKELTGVRNKWAHRGTQDFDDDYTWRALDTMARLCEQIDAESTEEIRSLLRKVRYGSESGSADASSLSIPANATKSSSVLNQRPAESLPSWRDVIEPHPDVAQGRYKNAEFAANLAQVARGEGSFEYRDPVEFFARTFITEGIKGLLVQSLKRVAGKDGEPVIQLKTAFGGGKTHSMLALYHLFRGKVSLEKIPSVKPVLDAAGLTSLPKANVAVLVGTDLDSSKSRRPNKYPGITINTLWGEMAAQLAESASNPKLYDFVKEADRKSVSPGAEALKNLFNACGPCIILIDELVAYARKIHGVQGLPAGSFDNLITFIQELTEAASSSKNSLVVASIPESNIEIGGEAGKIALETIEHTFGRMESIWKPVTANEGFEVVRRRLFQTCKNNAGREDVCRKFSEMYNENTSDFPIETKELEYKERLVSCYPIHPEIFDRLYGDWATLEHFQKTRGVLRLMATVIYELWMNNDPGHMIMPGSIPLDKPNVRDELLKYLPDNWNTLLDNEVDGKESMPFKKDSEILRFGQILASRRVARTIMLGSAPSVKEQAVRGIEASRIRLGVAQPGEQIAVFNDALSTLQNTLTYLYSSPTNDRFWYDTRPTLRKTVEDRASQIADSDAEYEIEQRLSRLRREIPFSGLHTCPNSSLDVPDDQSARLVVLHPEDTYKSGNEQCKALLSATEILSNRGTSPRIYRNMLAFLASDSEILNTLKQEVRRYLAWKSIKADSEDLNLDAAQNRETDNNLRRSDETVDLRLKETYCWLLVPYIDRAVDMKTMQWERTRISGGSEDIITKAAKKMQQNQTLIAKWAPALLLMELDNVLWKDIESIDIKTLWNYFCTYCYLPRLSNFDVLADAIKAGVNSGEYFALSEGYNQSDKRYMGLKINQHVDFVEPYYCLVKLAVANDQIEADKAKIPVTPPEPEPDEFCPPGTAPLDTQQPETPVAKEPMNRHFFMSAKLDNTRINRDVNNIVDEIIKHLTALDGSEVKIMLEVEANIPQGAPQGTVRTVTENCASLRIGDFGFDD